MKKPARMKTFTCNELIEAKKITSTPLHLILKYAPFKINSVETDENHCVYLPVY